ncbi:AAA family ATPase [Pseudomonas simiae]
MWPGGKWAYISKLSGEQKILDTLGSIDKSRDPSFFSFAAQTPIKLSSGQRSMFRFALHFIAHAGFGTLLIIDEPETYLHPNLVSDYMMLLYSILEQTRSVAIVATHSAYVVRETPTHCVHVLKKIDGVVKAHHVYVKTLGASVSELSYAVFGDSTVSAYHEKISEAISKSGLSFEQVIQSYGDIFSASMLVEIRSRLENSQGD